MKIVAIPAAIALGAIGAIAAERIHLPLLLGFAAGALAASLAVLALPSVPTRRATVVLLGVGGLGALRHASYASANRSVLLAVWAIATLVALVLVDRADAESIPPLDGGTPLPPLAARGDARVGADRGGGDRRGGGVRADGDRPARPPRLAGPGAERRRRDRRTVVAAIDSDELDMTSRPRLSDKVVFTVDSRARRLLARRDVRPLGRKRVDALVPSAAARSGGTPRTRCRSPRRPTTTGAQVGDELRQTFHIEAAFSDVIFAAPSPRVVETDKFLLGRPDGTAVVAGGLTNAFGRGSVYTVVSRHLATTAELLRAANRLPVPAAIAEQYAAVPEVASERVRALAREITANQPTTYDKILAIEAWLGSNTRYSLDAPLSPPGVDVVDDFLFRSRVGWCEQIASSLVVLARSAGIPARVATGFVPGQRDALTGRFVVRERDAHAWAEIFFPGIGWQGFDPTASVPLAGDAATGGSWLTNLRQHALPLALAAAALVLGLVYLPLVAQPLPAPPGAARVVGRAHACPARARRPPGGPGTRTVRDAPRVRARARRATRRARARRRRRGRRRGRVLARGRVRRSASRGRGGANLAPTVKGIL